ncbi:hypothetical protein [Mesorhizobium sp.]|uniref:hypothetical protein n=1 Tax=Mesorhizobium sp. TaxID=1871066 RepID=UPI00257F4D5F|nr:hypothetical protein [Mesorhizobium sp.]
MTWLPLRKAYAAASLHQCETKAALPSFLYGRRAIFGGYGAIETTPECQRW